MSDWDSRFLDVARLVSTWSRDPSTQVGAVITDSLGRIVSTGFNGFPRGVDDSPDRYNDRDAKLGLCVHAELNAILFGGDRVRGASIYIYPLPPCCECTKAIIQSGIIRIVYPDMPIPDRWKTSIEMSRMMLKEAGVTLDYV